MHLYDNIKSLGLQVIHSKEAAEILTFKLTTVYIYIINSILIIYN